MKPSPQTATLYQCTMPKKWLIALITRLLKLSTTKEVAFLGMILKAKMNNN
jgi:hypothetical protein